MFIYVTQPTSITSPLDSELRRDRNSLCTLAWLSMGGAPYMSTI